MHPVLIPQAIGVDGWPVVSALRLGTTVAPAEFLAVVECGEAGSDTRFGTVRVFVWPGGRAAASDGHYDLTFADAQHDLLSRARLVGGHRVEIVVEQREPYAKDRVTTFVDGNPETADSPVTTVAVIVYTDPDDWPDIGPELPELDRLSPAASDHVLAMHLEALAAAGQ